jgi:putative phosphoribosyl transferase
VPTERFRDRRDGGVQLARLLRAYANRSDVVVLALPRGGVPVAFEVATELSAPLDIVVVRKLGAPGHPELAMGAIATAGALYLNDDLIAELHIPPDAVARTLERERHELERRERLYRGDRPPIDVAGRTAIVVDDGLATGASVRVAVDALRRQRPAKIVVAVPVGAPEACAWLREAADEVVCCRTPEPFGGVGAWYEHFEQLSDDDVRAYLHTPPEGGDSAPPEDAG